MVQARYIQGYTKATRTPYPVPTERQRGEEAHARGEDLDEKWPDGRKFGWKMAERETGWSAFDKGEVPSPAWSEEKKYGYYKANDEHTATVARVSRPEDAERTCGVENCSHCRLAS